MCEVAIHPRVKERHPEFTDAEVIAAWKDRYAVRLRFVDGDVHMVALGYDTRGRELEMVAVQNRDGSWFVFHAMTPPSRKTYVEVGRRRT